ncbi:MAG TPA: PASTA domain-containing protein [Candidatus Kapabacteria bacterium]|nr:PASTA domain-containing protein [Candidatus Kapabacteria bacterium]
MKKFDENMRKKALLVSRIVGYFLFYVMVFIASVFFTMSVLIKSAEIKAPDLRGKSLNEAYKIAAENGLYLKKESGNYGKQYHSLTVINQFPAPGVQIKEKSFIKVLVPAEVEEVAMPQLTGANLKESESLLKSNNLKKRFISYIDVQDVPVDVVIAQSIPAGARVPGESEVDILVSRGARTPSYIMPDIIGKRVGPVEAYFNAMGLRISEKVRVSYPVQAGIIVGQNPTSGFQINEKARIRIEVSE